MEKLELKHIVGYLPYGIKMQYKSGNECYIEELTGLGEEFMVIAGETEWIEECYYKPILRPISYLTKEIEVNGEKFVPLIRLAKKYADSSGYNDDIKIFRNKCFCYSKSSEKEFRFSGVDFNFSGLVVSNQMALFQKLYEWHFDIHGGIGKWAIDINTIDNGIQ